MYRESSIPLNDCRCRCGLAPICGRANEQGGSINLVDDLPLHTTDAAHRRVGKLIEGGGREVEVIGLASLAPVGQLDEDGRALD
jgi:hypothetical protein